MCQASLISTQVIWHFSRDKNAPLRLSCGLLCNLFRLDLLKFPCLSYRVSLRSRSKVRNSTERNAQTVISVVFLFFLFVYSLLVNVQQRVLFQQATLTLLEASFSVFQLGFQRLFELIKRLVSRLNAIEYQLAFHAEGKTNASRNGKSTSPSRSLAFSNASVRRAWC